MGLIYSVGALEEVAFCAHSGIGNQPQIVWICPPAAWQIWNVSVILQGMLVREVVQSMREQNGKPVFQKKGGSRCHTR